jgi:hypothetical protein
MDLASVPYYESYEKRYSSKARKNLRRFEERPPQKYTSCLRDNGPASSPYR